jgi:RNA polymerase sigma-70 factor, ECF subfamily
MPGYWVNGKNIQMVLDASIVSLTGGSKAVSELDDIHLLAQRYRPKLLRYIAFTVGDADLADSIAQDCLLKAYQARDSFRGECSVNTWMFSIANNLIRDHTRNKKFQFWKKAHAKSVDVAEIASIQPSGERSPEEKLLLRERTEQIYQALQRLSTNQRRVFMLKFLEDLDVAEISTAIGMPANTVKTHLRRAVTSMRTRLGGVR